MSEEELLEELRGFVENNMEHQEERKQEAVNGSPAFSGALGREQAYRNVLNWVDNRTDS